MKKVSDYLKLPYRLVIVPDPDEGGFAVSYPDLPGCISTGDTIDEAVKNAEDAKKPVSDDLENYSGQFKIRIPKSLHRSLSIHAKEEGISMNQYCLYLLSKNDRSA